MDNVNLSDDLSDLCGEVENRDNVSSEKKINLTNITLRVFSHIILGYSGYHDTSSLIYFAASGHIMNYTFKERENMKSLPIDIFLGLSFYMIGSTIRHF